MLYDIFESPSRNVANRSNVFSSFFFCFRDFFLGTESRRERTYNEYLVENCGHSHRLIRIKKNTFGCLFQVIVEWGDSSNQHTLLLSAKLSLLSLMIRGERAHKFLLESKMKDRLLKSIALAVNLCGEDRDLVLEVTRHFLDVILFC